MKAAELETENRELNGVKVDIRTYRIGDSYYCHVANTDPGATISRSQAQSREQAKQIALQKAMERLKTP